MFKSYSLSSHYTVKICQGCAYNDVFTGQDNQPIKDYHNQDVGRGASSIISSARKEDGNANNVDGICGRRSKRLRILSSKLDGRYQYDKKTKVLVGHPSPGIKQLNVYVDPE
ncbi:hypothetical protein AtNW77_Chr3g0195441 [Arabidopsis thaliana]